MKLAKEWMLDTDDSETDPTVPITERQIKIIQLDAWKQGVSDSAAEVSKHWNQLGDMTNQYEQAQRSARMLINLRGNKTTL